jgi:hypothetical protein
MPASYPTSTWGPTTKVNGDSVDASHIDDAQTEIVAIEADLRAGLPIARGGTGGTDANTAIGNLFASPSELRGTTPQITIHKHLPSDGGSIVYSYNGIDFALTQKSSTATVFDDYSEGTWTPALKFGGASTGMTYSTQSGYYVKVAQLVFVMFRITLTALGSSTGAATVTGLPYTNINSTASYSGATSHYHQNFTSIVGWITGYIAPNDTQITLVTGNVTPNGVTGLTQGNCSATTDLIMSGCFRASA